MATFTDIAGWDTPEFPLWHWPWTAGPDGDLWCVSFPPTSPLISSNLCGHGLVNVCKIHLSLCKNNAHKVSKIVSGEHECAYKFHGNLPNKFWYFKFGPDFSKLPKISIISKFLGDDRNVMSADWGPCCSGSGWTVLCFLADLTGTWCPWRCRSQKEHEEELVL